MCAIISRVLFYLGSLISRVLFYLDSLISRILIYLGLTVLLKMPIKVNLQVCKIMLLLQENKRHLKFLELLFFCHKLSTTSWSREFAKAIGEGKKDPWKLKPALFLPCSNLCTRVGCLFPLVEINYLINYLKKKKSYAGRYK